MVQPWLSDSRRATEFNEVGAIRDEHDGVILAGRGQRVSSRALEVGPEGNDVSSRTIGRKRNPQNVTSAGRRGRIDGAGCVAGTGDPARVAIRGRKRQGDGAAKRNRAVGLVQWGSLRDRRATGKRRSCVSVTGRQHRGYDLVGPNRDRWLRQQVQFGVGDGIS